MLSSRQDLAEYALRKLGAPVINIEVADEQLDDAIEDVILMFQEYHPDGITRDYVKHQVGYTTITVNDASLIDVGDTIATDDSSAVVRLKNTNILSIDRTTGNPFEVGDVVTYTGGTATVTVVTLGDIDNRYIPIGNDIVGISKIIPWQPSVADGLFDITYQLRMNDLRNLSSGNMSYFTMSMDYLSMLDFFLRKEKQFRFNRRMGNLYLDVNWEAEVHPGMYMIVECYRTVDDQTYTDMYNDTWIKKYAIAKVKQQWGNNLRKYSNVALPGGVTLNGENILAEATAEIQQLEGELVFQQAPLSFSMG